MALALGLTPLGSRLVELAGRPFGGHWIAQAILGGLAVVLVADLVTLPFSAWRHSVLTRYGLATNGWGGWAVDLLKSYAVSAVIGAVALLGFYTVVRLAPRWWWAFGAAGAATLVALLSFVLPVLVEPVFNRFRPMEPSPLRSQLMELPNGTECRCATCWSPTPPGAPGRSTRTSPGWGRPAGWWSTTTCCARRRRPR